MAHAECVHGTDLTLYPCTECDVMDRDFANRVDGIIGGGYAEKAKYQADCLGTQACAPEPISSEQYLNEQIRNLEDRLEFARWLKEAMLRTPPHERLQPHVSNMVLRALL